MSSASDIMAAVVVVILVITAIAIIQGVEFSQTESAFGAQSLIFNQKHALNNLNAVLATSVPQTKGTVLEMIENQVYYKNDSFDYNNSQLDLKNLTQQTFDYAFGKGNYFAYATPNSGTIHLIFIINGNTYFGGAASSLSRVLPTILDFSSNYQFDVKFYVLDMGVSGGMNCSGINEIFKNSNLDLSCTDLLNTTMNYYYSQYSGLSNYPGFEYEDWLLGTAIAANNAINSSQTGSILIFPISSSFPGGSQPNSCTNSTYIYPNQIIWCTICSLDCAEPIQNSIGELNYVAYGNSNVITANGINNLAYNFKENSNLYLFPIQYSSCGISENYWSNWYYCNKNGGYVNQNQIPLLCTNTLQDCFAITNDSTTPSDRCVDQACDANLTNFDLSVVNPQNYGLMPSRYIGNSLNLINANNSDSALLSILNESINSISNYSFSIGVQNLSANRISIQKEIPLSNSEQGTLTFWLYSSPNSYSSGGS